VRLEMRSLAGTGAVVSLSFVAVSCCKPYPPLGDVVSGAPKGSALVKVVVKLADNNPKDKVCVATVDPPLVIVFRGSAIRWMVDNKCTNPKATFLQFTAPQPHPPKKDGDPYPPKPWDYRFCTGRTATLTPDKERNVLFCEVPETVVPGRYKYGLEGAAEQDPDIEVRKSH
jgi:hypothetical protein